MHSFLHRRAEVVSAAVRDEGALRMRHTPCGCAPYGEGGFDVFFIRAKHTKVIHHSLLALSLTGY